MGRPKGARGIAKDNGEITYISEIACSRCNGIERYTSSGGCVFCTCRVKNPADLILRDMAYEEQSKAIARGAVTFTGRPCRKCGSTERYTAGNACVACVKGRVKRVREKRAALYHSDTSPIVWVNTPPSPETAPFYAMCPSLAAYAGQWTVVYSDAQHLMPHVRLFPGCDVLRRPSAMASILNDKTCPGHDIAVHLIPAYYPALSAFNMRLK